VVPLHSCWPLAGSSPPEQTLEHERENAAEQRITELYTRG
jgi:hypothetical protein